MYQYVAHDLVLINQRAAQSRPLQLLNGAPIQAQFPKPGAVAPYAVMSSRQTCRFAELVTSERLNETLAALDTFGHCVQANSFVSSSLS